MKDWPEELPGAITVCDKDFTIVYMNAKARATFADSDGAPMLGKSLLGCHKPESIAKMKEMLESGRVNTYTIRKNGIKKMVWQSPWRESGKIAGIVEISIELPENMPHYDRDKV
ncbi:MAG: PAS domain-containing protein [Rectinema sp.]